jgi:hypothetical protein
MFSLLKYLFSYELPVQKKTVLFDYKKDKLLYLSRCKPVLEKMIDNGLINKFLNCNSVEDFGLPDHFTQYDFDHITYARSILEQISKKTDHIEINSDEDLDKIVKIIMKKYLLNIDKNFFSTNKKVSIEVNVKSKDIDGSTGKLQVVSYANKTSDGLDKLKNPGGSIDKDEEPIDAAKRELEEELGLIIQLDRFELINVIDEKYYNYKVNITLDEYQEYIANLDKLEIDSEITMICLV